MSATSREVPWTFAVFEDILHAPVAPRREDLYRRMPGFRRPGPSKAEIKDALYSLRKAGLIETVRGKGKKAAWGVTTIGYEAAVLFGNWEMILDRERVPDEERQ